MREILFRGKDRSSWLYGSLTQGRHSHIWVAENVIYQVFPESVGQDTGRLDCNKNKIFEGDILECKNLVDSKYLVAHGDYVVSDYCYGWHVKSFNKKYCDDFLSGSENLFKIIGNIFDNPEFLK